MAHSINKNRLQVSIEQLSQFTEKDRPWTRRAFTSLYLEARKWLAEQFQQLNCLTYIDESGNLIAKMNNNTKQTIVIGSHIDTVPNGGKLDGIYGVLAGLEIMRTLKENNTKLAHNIEVIDFLSEEVSDFCLSCIGSRGMVRQLDTAMLAYKNGNNKPNSTLNDAINNMGGDTSKILTTPPRSDIRAFLECHIEQGQVLEQHQLDIGVVTSIVGLSKLEVVFKGRSNHAGTTPMHLRADAMVALSDFVLAVNKLAYEANINGKDYLVATAGAVELTPNTANVIPGQAKVILDIRSTSQKSKESFIAKILLMAERIAKQYSVRLASHRLLSNALPTPCHREIIKQFKTSCENLNFSYRLMPSGAGHDCAFLTQIAPAAMIFIPSKNGISHSPDEYSSPDELAKGCQVMFNTLLTIDKNNI